MRSLFSGKGQADQPVVTTRASRGLEQFFTYIHGQSGLRILDLGGTCQQNVSFITNLGHGFSAADFVRIVREMFSEAGDQSNPGQIEHFLNAALDYPEQHFDGVLMWDALEYLEPALLTAVVERLDKIVRPGSYLLAFFHSEGRAEPVPTCTFRIQDLKTLHLTEHGKRTPVQLFNNRSVEKLFSKFNSVKFFLTRERLREVIVKM